MNALTVKRGDVFFCQGSPEAIGSEERKTRPVVVIQNDAGNTYSPTVIVANMTSNTDRRLYPFQFDFRHLTQKGLSVSVCPLPALKQVNITVTDGKDVCLTRNIGAGTGGIVEEIADMKDALAGVAP